MDENMENIRVTDLWNNQPAAILQGTTNSSKTHKLSEDMSVS